MTKGALQQLVYAKTLPRLKDFVAIHMSRLDKCVVPKTELNVINQAGVQMESDWIEMILAK